MGPIGPIGPMGPKGPNTMKTGAALLLLLLLPLPAVAHPGVGIVQDARGNIFYTDLTQVWKISPDGRKTVAVPNVHTHELSLDMAGNLYGEHLWFDGATSKWRHRVWMMR